MSKIQDNSMEEKELFRIVKKIENSITIEREEVETLLYLIDTTEKLEALAQWLESKTEGTELKTDESELMNTVSRISRA